MDVDRPGVEALMPVSDDSADSMWWGTVDVDVAPWSRMKDPAVFEEVERRMWDDAYLPQDPARTASLLADTDTWLTLLIDGTEERFVDSVYGYDLVYRWTTDLVERMYTDPGLQEAFHGLLADHSPVYNIHQTVVHPAHRNQGWGTRGILTRQAVMEAQWNGSPPGGGEEVMIADDADLPDPGLLYANVRYRALDDAADEPHVTLADSQRVRPIYYMALEYCRCRPTPVTYESGGYAFNTMFKAPDDAVEPAELANYFPDRFLEDQPVIEV